jgi:uncharacterized membrane protein
VKSLAFLKKQLNKQRIIFIFGILFLSVFLEMFYIYRVSRIELPLNYDNEAFVNILENDYALELVNLRKVNKNEMCTVTADPQIIIQMKDDKSGGVRIRFSEEVSQNLRIQVFWAFSENAFSEENSTTVVLQRGNKEVIAVIPYEQYQSLRIDIGDKEEIKYSLDSIEVYDGKLSKTFKMGQFSIIRWIFWIGLVLLFSYLVMSIMHNESLEKIAFFTILLLGMLYMFILPPYSAPDEERHIMTTYKYSSQLMGKEATNDEGKVILYEDTAIENGCDYYRPNMQTYKLLYGSLEIAKNENYKVGVQNVVDSPFITYLPQILGVTIARILGFEWFTILFFGRMFSILCFAICMYYAVKWMPKGKTTILAVALLPMTLELVSSFSYDAELLMIVFLFISYIFKLSVQKSQLIKRDWIILAGLSILFAFQKVVYMPMLLLLFFVFKGKEKEYIKKAKWKLLLIFLIAAGCIMTVYFGTIFKILGETNNAVNAGGTGHTYTLGDLLYNPRRLLSIYWNTFLLYIDAYPKTLLGGSLGWLELDIPWSMLNVFIILIVMAIIEDSGEPMILSMKQKILILLISFSIVILVYASMLFGWTPNSSNVIIGVQGRYFLPILPICLLCGINTFVEKRKSIKRGWVTCMIIQNMLVIMKVFHIIIHR